MAISLYKAPNFCRICQRIPENPVQCQRNGHYGSRSFRMTTFESCEEEKVYRDFEKHLCAIKNKMERSNLSLDEINSNLVKTNRLLKNLQRPTTNTNATLVVAGGKGSIGAERSYEIYDNTTKSWTLYKNAFFFDHYNSFSFPYDDNIMICGGGNNQTKTESLDINAGSSYTTHVSLPSGSSGKGVLCGDHIITFGDSITKTLLKPPYSSEVVLKYSKRESWSDYGVECVNGKAVLVGGLHQQSSGIRNDEVMIYDPSTNEFTELAPLPYGMDSMATVAYDDNLIILGGRVHSSATNIAMMYNINSQLCRMLPRMLQKRSGCAAVIMGDTIVVMGGSNESCWGGLHDDLNTVEYLVLGQNTWNKLPPMHHRRYCATASVYL